MPLLLRNSRVHVDMIIRNDYKLKCALKCYTNVNDFVKFDMIVMYCSKKRRQIFFVMEHKVTGNWVTFCE